ncbi:DUF2254 domain-containing protein [Thalassospira sp.]|uniref:DUF2254 domain-containing protein n=1 Tax=Thalassospira sp. TaxID=1912094 RepID=UPI000C56A500|nr:DUF2254 domain-containing protein [Thalassospira sp.]MBC05830.1 hypothetical protein [Thalassospira sp.]|tara:strand:- start:1855 stop:3219 length:1365 start_codon:yes stop_codon:yes gene_type:complete
MVQRLIRVWEFLAYSLWLSPLLFAVGGAAIAVGVMALPQDWLRDILPEILPGFSDIDTVRSLLETLLATLVTMTTFALSITMVVLTLAAGSLGPRMIRNFMGDNKTQNALGIFVGSILFLITSLVMMGSTPGSAPVPHLATTVGIALFVISVFVLILFVHHLGRSIVADEVIQRVGKNLEETIQSACTTLSEPIKAAEKAQSRLPDPQDIAGDQAICIGSSGYVQGIDYEKICEIAKETDTRISLVIRAGQHVLAGDIVGQIDPAKDGTSTKNIDQCHANILDAIMIGTHRTAMLDVEFALRQLVEVALRALSPGINDPFTAIAAVYRLGRALPHAMQFRYPVGIWIDGSDEVRLKALLSDFDGMLGAAYDQIRQSAARKPDVLLPMAEVLESLMRLAHTDQQRDTLRTHARMIASTAERNVPEENDRKAVLKAATRVLHHQEPVNNRGGEKDA